MGDMKIVIAFFLLMLFCIQYLPVGCAEHNACSIVYTLENIHNLQDLAASSLSFSPFDGKTHSGYCTLRGEEGLAQAAFPSECANSKEIFMVFDLDYDNAAAWFLSLEHEMLSELGQPSDHFIQPNLTEELDDEIIHAILSGEMEDVGQKIVLLQWIPESGKEWSLYAADIECGIEICLLFRAYSFE